VSCAKSTLWGIRSSTGKNMEYMFFFTSNSYVSCCFYSSGGKCLSVEYTDKVGEIAKIHGLKLHIDGARIFNASVVSSSVHVLQFCFATCFSLLLPATAVSFSAFALQRSI
jgi:threonine aldolase